MTTTDVFSTIVQWLTRRMEINSAVIVEVTDNPENARFDIRVEVMGEDIDEEMNRVREFLYDYTADHEIVENVFTCWMPDRFTQEFVLTYEI